MENRPSTGNPILVLVVFSVLCFSVTPSEAVTLEVGPNKKFRRIEDANDQAKPGDLIFVYPLPSGKPYSKTAVVVKQRNLTFRSVPSSRDSKVKLSGSGFDYSGNENVPRAIFQINPTANRCRIEGFDLSEAHNENHNGSAVRINRANNVMVRDCEIHHCDMGIMSSGDGTPKHAINQQIFNCNIHHNGAPREPGFSHNLYLGGTSVSVVGCEIHHSLAGHNVKSRAHHTRVQCCYVHHSANREFDLVDHVDTARPKSHAVLIGNTIVKDPEITGNRTVIHFGQDGGRSHNGTLHLFFNTIITPFISPVVQLSTRSANALLVGNLVSNGGHNANNQVIAKATMGADLRKITGQWNWFCGDFGGIDKTRLDPKNNRTGQTGTLSFADSPHHHFQLSASTLRELATPLTENHLDVPPVPGGTTINRVGLLSRQYRHPSGTEKRPQQKTLSIGASVAPDS